MKTSEAVITVGQGVLVVKYKNAEGTSVKTHTVILIDTCNIFHNLACEPTDMSQSGDFHIVVIQTWKNGRYLVSITVIPHVQSADNPHSYFHGSNQGENLQACI